MTKLGSAVKAALSGRGSRLWGSALSTHVCLVAKAERSAVTEGGILWWVT